MGNVALRVLEGLVQKRKRTLSSNAVATTSLAKEMLCALISTANDMALLLCCVSHVSVSSYFSKGLYVTMQRLIKSWV